MKDEFEILPSELPRPWHWDAVDLTNQLKKELPDKHILTGKILKSVGRRQDNDDALFEIENDEFKYAVVHLTWAQKKLKDSHYPYTYLYKDWKDLYVNRILPDSDGWED